MRLLVIGAHPDDCEACAGGIAALCCQRGDEVLFLTTTNGDAGHFAIEPQSLAERRWAEAQAAAAVIGARCVCLGEHDAQLVASIAMRERLIVAMREFQPDLVITHRPCDYHPDHRYTSLLVQDASFLVTVPLVCRDAPALVRSPVIAYAFDDFRRPVPFAADIAVDVGAVMPLKWSMLHCHASQFYEWLPHNLGVKDPLPADDAARRTWLEASWSAAFARPADVCRPQLELRYGEKRGSGVRYAEAFEVCEFGSRPTADDLARLFPFA